MRVLRVIKETYIYLLFTIYIYVNVFILLHLCHRTLGNIIESVGIMYSY